MLTTLFTIGRDAVTRKAGNYEVTELALGYRYGKKDADGKQPMQWIKASMWGERGVKVAPYIKKGGQLVASLSEVHIESREHEGKVYTDLVGRVEDVRLVNQPKAANASPSPAPAPKPAPQQHIPGGGDGFGDDDIPFAPLHHRRALRFL